jgi:hypothetical protein
MIDFIIIPNIIWLKALSCNKQSTNNNRPNYNHSICNYMWLLVTCDYFWIIFATISCVGHICNYIPISLCLFGFIQEKQLMSH